MVFPLHVKATDGRICSKIKGNQPLHQRNVNYLLTFYTAYEESKGCDLKCGKLRAVTNYATNLETSLKKVTLEATAGSGLHGVPPKLLLQGNTLFQDKINNYSSFPEVLETCILHFFT